MEIIIPVFFVLLAQAVIFGSLCQSLCEKKGHEGGFWIGFFFGILGLLYVVGLPPTVIRRDSKPCPYCGGELEGQYELCKHCRSPLSYVDGIPCKPAQVDQLREDLEKDSEMNYWNQDPQVFDRNGISFIQWNCYCGELLQAEIFNIGTNITCPTCKRELIVIGDKDHDFE